MGSHNTLCITRSSKLTTLSRSYFHFNHHHYYNYSYNKHLIPPNSIITMSATPLQLTASSSSSLENGASNASNDLLIIGPGVLGRLVAQKWSQDHPACEIYGHTVTTHHHDELIRMGINPSLKGTKPAQKFPFVIFCAPPYQTADYSADIRYFVVVNSIACSHASVSLLLYLSNVNSGKKGLVMLITALDLMVTSLLFSATGASATVGVLAYKGNSHVHWSKLCSTFERFCSQLMVGSVFSLIGAIVFLLLVLLSFFKNQIEN